MLKPSAIVVLIMMVAHGGVHVAADLLARSNVARTPVVWAAAYERCVYCGGELDRLDAQRQRCTVCSHIEWNHLPH